MSCGMKTFNINMPVIFKPTEYGKQHYRNKRIESQEIITSNGSDFKITLDLKVNQEGWCKMQMHDFMEHFGDTMYLGGEPAIESCEIVFFDGDLTEFDKVTGFEK